LGIKPSGEISWDLSTNACEDWLRRTARMKPHDWFNGWKGGFSKASWSATRAQ